MPGKLAVEDSKGHILEARDNRLGASKMFKMPESILKASMAGNFDAAVNELVEMSELLKQHATGLRQKVKKDIEAVSQLEEKTDDNLDNVTSLNQRVSAYVETSTGMTCTMFLMSFIVIITFVGTFILIYFI